jgi:hypothetical protein
MYKNSSCKLVTCKAKAHILSIISYQKIKMNEVNKVYSFIYFNIFGSHEV